MKQSTAVKRGGDAPFLRLATSDEMVDRMNEMFDAVARRAFEIFEGSGRRPGRDLDDWLQAEAELLHPVHLEISETDAAFTVRAEVPGFTEKDIEIDLEPRRLTITGRRQSRDERKQGRTVYSERCSNRMFRVTTLPADVDTTSKAVVATYDQGVLTITLPKRERAKPREIKVEAKPAV